MTAQSVAIDADVLDMMSSQLLNVDGVCGIYLDLTHKPPGTIEWE
jgi:GMP synthase (glutamine-hydrolysing)